MRTYIAFLRGINVGGHKKILMADLRELLKSTGFKDVQTYIQSGNAIFFSKKSAEECENIIKDIIFKKYGWVVPVLVKEPKELLEVLDLCPFSNEKKKNSYFFLLSDKPADELVKVVQKLSIPDEEFHIRKNTIYFWSDNYARSKFNNNFFERRLKVNVTARNYNTMVKLIDLGT